MLNTHLLLPSPLHAKASILPAGPCKAVLGRPDSNSATRLKAVDLSQPDHASRLPSDTTLRRLSPSMMFAKTSMPVVGASSSRKDHVSGQGFLGRGLSGEPCTVQPVMAMHQLNSQDHFVVRQSGCIAALTHLLA